MAVIDNWFATRAGESDADLFLLTVVGSFFLILVILWFRKQAGFWSVGLFILLQVTTSFGGLQAASELKGLGRLELMVDVAPHLTDLVVAAWALRAFIFLVRKGGDLSSGGSANLSGQELAEVSSYQPSPTARAAISTLSTAPLDIVPTEVGSHKWIYFVLAIFAAGLAYAGYNSWSGPQHPSADRTSKTTSNSSQVVAQVAAPAASQLAPPATDQEPDRGHPALIAKPNDWGRIDSYPPYTKQLPLPLQASVTGGPPQLRWLGQYVCTFLNYGFELRVTNYWDRQVYEFRADDGQSYGFETLQRRADQPMELTLTSLSKDGRYVSGDEADVVFGLLQINDDGRPAPHTC